jgi:hypothetical protein
MTTPSHPPREAPTPAMAERATLRELAERANTAEAERFRLEYDETEYTPLKSAAVQRALTPVALLALLADADDAALGKAMREALTTLPPWAHAMIRAAFEEAR